MNRAIANLEKRKNRVLKLRANYVNSCEKEEVAMIAPDLHRYDNLIDRIIRAIKTEWNRSYLKSKPAA